MVRPALLAGLAAAVLSASPARATAFCDIKPTKDGFVALRDGPSPASRILHRMRPGDEVLLGTERAGPWIKVTYWRGGRFRTGRNPTGDPPTSIGWMNRVLLAPDSCG